MKNFTLFLTGIFLLAGTSLFAQKIKVVEGDPGVLKGQSSVKLVFTYDNMRVGKYKNEADYVNKKRDDYNAKEPGRGDRWAEAWVNDREARFQPKFEELMNKYLGEKGITVSENTKESKYTMIVNTTFTEPGYNVAVSRRPASINLEIKIVETDNPDNVLAVITLMGAPGTAYYGNDYDTGERIKEAYAKAGKELAKFLVKKYLK